MLLSDMENSLLELDIQNLATATHGFVGADLAALCNEAAFVCLRRFVDSRVTCSGSKFVSSNYSKDNCRTGVTNSCYDQSENDLKDLSSTLSKMDISSQSAEGIELGGTFPASDPSLRVTFEDLEKARLKVRPSAMREVCLVMFRL